MEQGRWMQACVEELRLHLQVQLVSSPIILRGRRIDLVCLLAGERGNYTIGEPSPRLRRQNQSVRACFRQKSSLGNGSHLWTGTIWRGILVHVCVHVCLHIFVMSLYTYVCTQ